MFSLLSSNSQIYGLPQTTTTTTTAEEATAADNNKKSNSLPHKHNKQQQQQQQHQGGATTHRRSTSSLSDTGGKFFANLSAKSPSQFIEKFIRNELLNGYDTLKCQVASAGGSSGKSPTDKEKDKSGADNSPLYSNLQTDWGGFSCLQGSYRSHGDGEFYEAVQVKSPSSSSSNDNKNDVNMRSKSSLSGAATLQHYQKLPEPGLEVTQYNTQAAGHTPAGKKPGLLGGRLQKQTVEQVREGGKNGRKNDSHGLTLYLSPKREVGRSG